MLVKTVATVVTTNAAGQVVESIPVRASDVPLQNEVGQYVDPVPMTEDPGGVPIRIVAGNVTTDSVGKPVSAILGSGIAQVVLAMRPVFSRIKQTFVATHSSDGVNTSGNYIVRHNVLPGGCASGLKLAFTNHCSEADGFNAITVGPCAVRFPAGTGPWYPLTFGGLPTVTIQANGADVWCDAIAGLPAMAVTNPVDGLYRVSVASAGMKWPTIDGLSLAAANGEGSTLSTGDISGSIPTPLNTTEYYGPVAASGMSTATDAGVIIGDSIANGAAGLLTSQASGFIEQKFIGTIPTLNCATSSERISQFSAAHSRRLALAIAAGCNKVIFSFGTNDALNGDSYSTIRSNLLAVLAKLAAYFPDILICPIITKTDASLNPSGAYAVAGIVDQVNAFIMGVDIGLVSKFWDTRVGWQNASNQILSATLTDDFLHPNAVGNAAIVTAGPSAATLLNYVKPTRPVPPAWFVLDWIYLRAADLGAALNDGDLITTWQDTKGLVTATWAGEKPKYRTNQTPTGKPAVKFDIAGTGLQKLAIPHGPLVDNIFNTGVFGAFYTVSRYASAGGNGTGRLWTKGVGETCTLLSSTSLRTTIDFVTADIQLAGTTAINTWYVRQEYKNVGNVGSLLQNTLNTATATGTGTGGHVDNSASDLIFGNHDTLARGHDGDLACAAWCKGGSVSSPTADALWAVQAYLRADAGVTVI